LNRGVVFSARSAALPTLAKIIKPDQIDSIEGYSLPEEFDLIARQNEYALFHDINGDSTAELIFMQTEGSMPSYWVYICRFDKRIGKFKVVKTFGQDLFPVVWENHLYFIEYLINFDSKKLQGARIFDMSKQLNLIDLSYLKARYVYDLTDSLKEFIRQGFLTSLEEFSVPHIKDTSFCHLGDVEETLQLQNGDSITYHVFNTSNGYPSRLKNVNVYKRNGQRASINDLLADNFLCGFDLVEFKGDHYLVAADEGTSFYVVSLSSLQIYKKFNLKRHVVFE
jgi:hypothetical protein